MRWGGLRLGDVVAPVASARRMVVTDLDLDDEGEVTCAWRCAGQSKIREGTYRVSALVFVARMSRG